MPDIHIFDLDHTLWNGHKLYPNTRDILKTIRKKGHTIYLASYNYDAPSILKSLKIGKYFHGGNYGQKLSKQKMVKEILRFHKFKKKYKPKNIYFYDDTKYHINDVSYGLNGAVNAKHIVNGILWDHIEL